MCATRRGAGSILQLWTDGGLNMGEEVCESETSMVDSEVSDNHFTFSEFITGTLCNRWFLESVNLLEEVELPLRIPGLTDDVSDVVG